MKELLYTEKFYKQEQSSIPKMFTRNYVRKEKIKRLLCLSKNVK